MAADSSPNKINKCSLRRSLKHCKPVRGIRCDRALPIPGVVVQFEFSGRWFDKAMHVG